jgi:hypothetical protein
MPRSPRRSRSIPAAPAGCSPEARSYQVGSALEERGYELGYASSYLRHRNWIQVCLMGEHGREELELLPRLLGEAVGADRK